MPRDERPRIPPERKAVSEFPTPSPAVVIYTELVNRDDTAYYANAPVKRGSLYSSMVGANQTVISQYPNLYFLRERKFGQSDQLVLWDWATEPFAEDAYNSEVENVANAVGFPAFTRVYTIRRDVYDDSDDLVIGSTLTALIGVTITAGGEGYTQAVGRIDGTDVDISFVISYGQIIGAVINNEGSGVTASSAIDIIGDGINAQAIPIVQPTNCYLTSQKKQEFPEDHPLRNEFVRVTRTYETLPGPFIESTHFDTDGVIVKVNTRRNIAANINSGEAFGSGLWTQITKKGDDDFVGEEVVQTRTIPGNTILETQVNKDGDATYFTRTLVRLNTIATSSSIVAGVWTKTYQVPLSGTDLIATEVQEVRNTQYALPFFSVEIPDLVPQEFRAFVPTTTTETTEIGTASLPTLATGDLFRSERQLDAYTFRRTITGRAGLVLPITHCNTETTEVFGGGILNVCMTLELLGTGTVDTGLTVVSSSMTNLGNGTEIKQTSTLDDPAWPILHGTHIDEKYLVEIDIEKQTVAEGTTGGVLPDGTIVEVKTHDKWRSIQFSSKLNTDTLPEDTQWFSGQRHSFPPELTDAIIEYAEATCGCQEKFSAVLQANMNQYTGFVKTRVTEQFYNGPPPDDVVIDQFFPQAHVFGFAFAAVCGCGSDDTSRVTAIAPQFRIPLCLHDDLNLNIGIFFTWSFPATSPATLPHGSYIMTPPHVERWRFGVFRRVLTEILVP